MWFTYALATIFAWGGSDLFSKMGTRPDDKYSHWRLVIMVGTVMGLHAILYYMVYRGMRFDPWAMVQYFPVAAMYILSMALGYAGLRYIQLSVSSPICNSSGAVTALLCFLVLGQRMEGLQLFAVALICAGIFALGLLEKREDDLARAGAPIERKYRLSAVAILFPILYCLIDGMGSFMDAWVLGEMEESAINGFLGLLPHMDEDVANMAYELTFFLMAIIGYGYLRFVKKDPFSFRREKIFGLGALCETAGQFTYVFAMADNAIVAAPMIASYSIMSVLLSRIFLKEKLSKAKYVVIAVVMVGIFILGFE